MHRVSLVQEIDTNIALKLYQVALKNIFDPNWTGLNFYYYLKHPTRDKKIIVSTPKIQGILYYLGIYSYREFLFGCSDRSFDIYRKYYTSEEGEMLNEGFFDLLKGDELVWHIEYVLNMIRFHCQVETTSFKKMNGFMENLTHLLDENKDTEYFRPAIKGKMKFMNCYYNLLNDYTENVFKNNEHLYVAFVMNRFFMDRELCKYIAEITSFTHLKERSKIPKNIKDLLLKRENGKCAICEKKLSRSQSTVDHIIPRCKGGINDIVNLQLTCYQCNQDKQSHAMPVRSSIPPIFGKILAKQGCRK